MYDSSAHFINRTMICSVPYLQYTSISRPLLWIFKKYTYSSAHAQKVVTKYKNTVNAILINRVTLALL